MSAAVQHAEPAVDQLPLLQSPEPGSMHVSVWGRLTRQAEVRVTTDGSGLQLPKGITIVVDLRRLSDSIGKDICTAPGRDVPGIVFFEMRRRFKTAKAFTKEAIAVGHVLRTDNRVAA